VTVTRTSRSASGIWSLGAIAVTTAVIVGDFATSGGPRVVAGIFAAIILPLAFGSIAIRQLSGSQPEVCITAALAGWSVFECLVSLALWLFGVRLSSTAVGIPNVVALAALLLTVQRALIYRRSPSLWQFRVRVRRLLWLTLPAVLLAGAALISIKSESTSYNRGDSLAISATRGRFGTSSITVINPTSAAQAVVISISAGTGTDLQMVARSVPANGGVELTRPLPSSQTLTATLFQHGTELGSVSLSPGSAPS